MRSSVPVWQTVHVEFIGQWSLMLLLLLKGAGQMSERLSSSVPPAWFRLIVKPFPDGTGDLSSSPFQETLLRWGIPACFNKYKLRNLMWTFRHHCSELNFDHTFYIHPRCLYSVLVYADCFKGVCGSVFLIMVVQGLNFIHGWGVCQSKSHVN